MKLRPSLGLVRGPLSAGVVDALLRHAERLGNCQLLNPGESVDWLFQT